MNIDKAMTTAVKCCHPHDSLGHAAGLLRGADCGRVPVVDEGSASSAC